VIGQFQRDWTGLLATKLVGGNLVSGSGDFFTSKDPLTAAGSPGDVPVQMNDAISNGPASIAWATHTLKAVEGEFLKWRSPGFSSLSDMAFQFAGASPNVL
jgi:hypothetical protein